ncbi:MAG: cytochrome c biogenesis protein CcsA [Deltaproteobacteria bacterium]|nr:cytochrome c biogenesis protein CcsA [Deltaproteobacteria bacterium]
MNWNKIIPWTVGLAAIAAALAGVVPPAPSRGFDLAAFSRLPVLEGGRLKPLDSVARNALLVIRGNQSFSFEGRTVKPNEWLLDVMFRPARADKQPVFVINDPEVLGMMGYEQKATNRYYTFEDLKPHLQVIQEQGSTAQRVDSKQRTRFQAAISNLLDRVFLYYRLKNTLQLDAASLGSLLKGAGSPQAGAVFDEMASLAYFRPLPPVGTARWRSVAEGLKALMAGDAPAPALDAYARLGAAWAAGTPEAFNTSLVQLRSLSLAGAAAELGSVDAETVFNRVQPFYAGMVIYVLALLVLFTSWLGRRELLQATALALLTSGAIVHTAGLLSRIVLQGRPPVTNLYSSAVFVGWGTVVMGLLLERIYRRGVGTAVAAASGFASLIVAHHLAADGDTMEMMRAVLDSNFWLATHVVIITIGYSGTFLAGAIAIAWALRQHLARTLEPGTSRALSSMVYGVICFSLLFSFTGTVLGGIWADQSWGRFWGWDPKENGALLIVLWCAVILHARWGGYVRERGIMAMAVGGNIITSLSWFGVNMLGVGLHSYGFMDNAFWALAGFCASQLVFVALCLVPRRGPAQRTSSTAGEAAPISA